MSRAGGSVVSERRLPLVLPVAIGGAWVVALVAAASGKAAFLQHDALLEDGPPFREAVGLFLASWLGMIIAMMLPSSLPMVRHYATVTARRGLAGAVSRFLLGYALVWTAFGVFAFLGDLGLHRLADRTPWVGLHPWAVPGSVLLAAGAFQFSALKERCLTVCRSPVAFLMRQYRRGVDDPLRLGVAHGLDCLGCCWALMLLMFAAGVANLAWMAALTGIMLYEKAAPGGDRLTPVVGAALLVWGTVVLLHPAWLPPAFAGVG
jgi:predicted metal-binding membrane protein